ncbi:MAG TPA: DUF3293 domain-containing protein, partial [Acidimicrobiales bacterium]|nr:DUF3293 domain-containing protein [Acidimicrobiales bacterium]
DGSWAEPGHLVAGLDRDGARALGRAFGQVAVFEWSQAAGVLAVVACDGARVVGRPARVAPVQATGAGAGPPGEGAGPSGC